MLSDEEGRAMQAMAKVAGQSVVAIWVDKLRHRRWTN